MYEGLRFKVCNFFAAVRLPYIVLYRLVTGGNDCNVKVWSLSNPSTNITTLDGHTGGIACLDTNSNHTAVSGSYDGTIRVWDVAKNKCKKQLIGHCGAVVSVKLKVST